MALILTLGVTEAFASLSFQVSQSPEASPVREAIRRINPLLPPSMVKKLGPIQVELINQGRQGHLGGAGKNRISLHLGAIRKAALEKKTSFENLLDSTLIHELSHIYDHLDIKSAEDLKLLKNCLNKGPKGPRAPISVPDEFCQMIQADNRTLSTNPRMRKLSHFTSTNMIGEYYSANHLLSRSPDTYELTSSEEFYAVNMEYFLRDPEYACRRPLIYQAFKDHFDFTPFPQVDCQDSISFLVTSNSGTVVGLEKIDPKKIYEIHYLQAAPGSSLASRFGHSMIRLIICAPHRTAVSADCLKDLMYHRVLSFRAKTESDSYSPIKGITGDYPSLLFYEPYVSVADEYNKVELRDLVSYPFQITEGQKFNFLRAASQTYWSYAGRYRFFSTNCASETLLLLQNAFPHNKALQKLNQGRPDTLLNALLRIELIERKNRSLVENKLYFSDSKAPFYQELVVSLSPFIRIQSMEAYLKKTSASQRLAALEKAISQNAPKKVYAAFMVFEERISATLLSESLTRFAEMESGQQNSIIQSIAQAREKWNQRMTDLRIGYGIPLSSDFQDLPSHKEQESMEANISQLTDRLMASLQLYNQSLSNHDLKISQKIVTMAKNQLIKEKTE